MQLKDICTLDVASCSRQTTIAEAARLMRHHHTGTLVVVDDPQGERTPAGVVTDRDIVVQALAEDLDPARTEVSRIMGTKVVMASVQESLADGIERMRLHGVRRLPIVDQEGGLAGIVTLDDLLALHAQQAATIAEIVSKEQVHERRTRR